VQALICDSCENPIENMNNRVEVLIITEEPIADPRLDLCMECGADVLRSNKVKRGQAKAKQRIENWMPPIVTRNPTGDPPDDYRPQLGDGDAPVTKDAIT
jgi:hypothetical protein